MSETAAQMQQIELVQLPTYAGRLAGGQHTTGPDTNFLFGMLTTIRTEQEQWVAGFSYASYRDIQDKLEVLLAEPDSDEFGPLRPSRGAVDFILQRVFELAKGFVVPSPDDVDSDHDGNIRISWRKDGRFLEVVTPYEPGEPSFVYYSEAEIYGLSPKVDVASLRNFLRWLETGAPL
jgi:hypothetical protein